MSTDYTAPKEHNPDFANVTQWEVWYTCRCGYPSIVKSEGRYVLQTCSNCGTRWEVAPSMCDATPHVVEKTADPSADVEAAK